MSIIFAAGTLFCLIYWAVLTVTCGFGGQHWIWLIFAAGCLLNTAAAVWYRRAPETASLALVTGLHTAAFAVMAVFLAEGILIASRMNPPETGELDYIVVLGAEVKSDGSFSETLEKRMERALSAALQYPGARIVLTGGSSVLHMASEAEYMGQYLLFNGIPEERILYEIQAKNTYENMLYTSAVIERIEEERRLRSQPATERPDTGGEVLEAERKPVRVGILSSSYHLCRARALAEKIMRAEISTIAAPARPVYLIHACFRECIALLKDKYLGRI